MQTRRAGVTTFRFDPPTDGVKLVCDTELPLDTLVEFATPTAAEICSTQARTVYELTRGGVLGQAHAERLLEHPEELSEDLRGYNLLFLGTRWSKEKQGECATYLFYAGGSWNLGVYWLDRKILPHFKIAVPPRG
jgi:hypothetical protein